MKRISLTLIFFFLSCSMAFGWVSNRIPVRDRTDDPKAITNMGQYYSKSGVPKYLNPSGVSEILGGGATAFALPTVDGAALEVMVTDGSGILSWAAQSGSGGSGVTGGGVTVYGTDGSSVSGASNIWIVNDDTGTSVTAVSDGKGGATVYVGGYSSGDKALFTGATIQFINHDPLLTQVITAATQAVGVTDYTTVHVSSDADYTLTTTPSIVGGAVGQVVYLHNKGTFDIDLQDNSILSGSSFFVGNSTGRLHADGTMLLQYDSDVSGFRVISNANTAAAGANAELLDARNASGGVLAAGDVVYINGWHVGSSRPTIAKADADDSTKMPAIGLVAAAINNNANGEVITAGSASGQIDTSSAAVGDGVWVSTTAGGVVFVRPPGDEIQKIGEVARANVSGVIVVFGAGRTNDTPHEIKASGVSVAAKAGGASGVSVFDDSGVTELQVDSNGVFVNTPALDSHATNKKYVDDSVGSVVGGDTNTIQMNLAGSLGGASIYQTATQLWVEDPATGATLFEIYDDGVRSGISIIVTSLNAYGVGPLSGMTVSGVSLVGVSGSGVSDYVWTYFANGSQGFTNVTTTTGLSGTTDHSVLHADGGDWSISTYYIPVNSGATGPILAEMSSGTSDQFWGTDGTTPFWIGPASVREALDVPSNSQVTSWANSGNSPFVIGPFCAATTDGHLDDTPYNGGISGASIYSVVIPWKALITGATLYAGPAANNAAVQMFYVAGSDNPDDAFGQSASGASVFPAGGLACSSGITAVLVGAQTGVTTLLSKGSRVFISFNTLAGVTRVSFQADMQKTFN